MEAGTIASDLAGKVSGEVSTPGSDGWDAARQAWNLHADQHPEAVVRPTGSADISATMAYAREHGLRVTAQALGHGAAAMGSLEGRSLIGKTGLDSIEVDPDGRVPRIGAGVTWCDVLNAAGEHGLAALPGSAPTVTAVPYSLGGG